MRNLKRRRITPTFSCFFVMVSICFSTLPFQMGTRSSFQASAQDSDIFAQDFDIFDELFHIPDAFKIDYLEMERTFKIFVYPHNTTACDKPRTFDGEYGNEVLFFLNLNQSRFLTKDPEKAHLFFIPTSCYSLPAEEWTRRIEDSAQDSDVIAEFLHIPEAFGMDYKEMERNFKIAVYPHNTTFYEEPRKLDDEYGNEGLLFEIHNWRRRFLNKDPDKAPLFLIPSSFHSLPADKGRAEDDRAIAVEDFVKGLIYKYPYWNRTLGADHFFVSCADIHVTATKRISNLMKNTIRVMCFPSYNDEYVPHKDISLPQSVQPLGLPGSANSMKGRNKLAYWRGLNNSCIRAKLLHAWENDSQIHIEQDRTKISTDKGDWMMFNADFYTSKFCICAGGPHLNRYITFSIHYGCVPVILSDYYDLPFIDILDWKKFSVILKERDVYQLKEILGHISDQEYQALQTNIVKVQERFRWKLPAVPLDAFHMVLYDLWQRRHVTKYYE